MDLRIMPSLKGLQHNPTFPGTPVPSYRLLRPFGTRILRLDEKVKALTHQGLCSIKCFTPVPDPSFPDRLPDRQRLSVLSWDRICRRVPDARALTWQLIQR